MDGMDFPRGGGESQQHKEGNKRRHEDKDEKRQQKVKKKDFLFDTSADARPVSKKRKTSGDKKGKSSKVATPSSSIGSLGHLGGGGVVRSKASAGNGSLLIEALSFSKLHPGVKLLGIVRQVNEDFAIIALPNMLNGYIRRKESSSNVQSVPVDQMVSVNQVLTVAVVKTATETLAGGESKRRIEVSVLPQHVNAGFDGNMISSGVKIRGRIRSLEDHGAVVDVGLSGVLAFLPFDQVEDYAGCVKGSNEDSCTSDDDDSDDGNIDDSSTISDEKNRRKLKKDMVFDAVIVSKTEQGGRPFLSLSYPSTNAFAEKVDDEELSAKVKFTIRTLSPGMKVNCFVEGYAQNGLLVNFLTHFRGAIDCNHLGGLYAGDKWRSVFKDGGVRNVTARVIAVDAKSKIIRLSLLSHILSLSLPPPFPSFIVKGSIIEDKCTVLRIDKGIGVLLGILPEKESLNDDFEPGEGGNGKKTKKNALESTMHLDSSVTRGIYVHISKVADEVKRKKNEQIKRIDLSKLFKVEKNISKVRITSTNQCLVEGWATGTTAEGAVTNGAIMDYSDIKPGSIHRGVEILSILESGILISLGNGYIKALCTNMHMSDTNFSKKASSIKNRLTVGKKLDSVRVLMVDAQNKRCAVTMKPTLLRDKSEPLTSFENCKRGNMCTGYITKLTSKGINVTFYNNVHGFISAKTLARDTGVEDPLENYEVGNTLVCRINSIEKRGSNFKLSLTLDNGDEHFASSMDTDFVDLAPGTTLHNGKVVKLCLGDESAESLISQPGHAVVHYSNPVKAECRLGFDQLLDEFERKCTNASLNECAGKLLKVGRRIKEEAVVLSSGVNGYLPSISLKKKLLSCISNKNKDSALCPSSADQLFLGAICVGFIVRIDQRYGAFVRFLNGLTGIIPKLKKGCEMPLYETVYCKVIALDLADSEKPKVLLQKTGRSTNGVTKKATEENSNATKAMLDLNVGDSIDEVKVENVNFQRANVVLQGKKFAGGKGRVRVYFTMATGIESKKIKEKKHRRKISKVPSTASPANEQDDAKLTIPEHHPFFGWNKGDMIKGLHVVGKEIKDGIPFIELSNYKQAELLGLDQIKAGMVVSGVVTSYYKGNSGLFLQVSPGVQGIVYGLELSKDAKKLNNMSASFPIGSRLDALVLNTKGKNPYLSVLGMKDKENQSNLAKNDSRKPKRDEIVIGRVHRFMNVINGPALMLDLRGNFTARCCYTELAKNDDWKNMPAGKINHNEDESSVEFGDQGDFPHGMYAECRVLGGFKGSCVNVSLRKGNCEEYPVPEEGDIVKAYVIQTDRKGCFVRLSSRYTGRIVLKELADDFIPNPGAAFPQGRLITAKVKSICKNGSKTMIDLDMRESTMIADGTLLKIEDLEEGNKVKGTVSRVERYGVFVKIDDSDVSGMSHLSECSDKFIGNLEDMYDPGDRVKAIVLKIDKELKRVSLGLKASYFENDEDTSGSSEDESDEDDSESEIEDDDSSEDNSITIINNNENSDSSPESDVPERNLIAQSKKTDGYLSEDSITDESNSDSSDESSESDTESVEDKSLHMESVGFDWDASETLGKRKLSNESSDSDSDSSGDESEDDSKEGKTSKHSSRKKAVKRRREEAEVARREAQLADGTADENPVTAADFERLLAGDPNSSEIYIRFMAYYLSLSDIDSARNVAERAFNRIEFREEGEKLNVWSALLVLEMKYGSENTFNETIDRASNQNNPKQVYLRVCEMLEKEANKFDTLSKKSNAFEEAVSRADDMFVKMCKKFRAKKTVWIAHLRYLLKSGRHEAAHDVLKRAILSLPEYKHVATVNKLAQLEFEFGSAERARTLFDGLIEKYPKRLDLVFVFIDMEIKHGGGIKASRRIFTRIINQSTNKLTQKKKFKFSDKQMKSVFKKWFKLEEDLGDEESQDNVKAEARAYVERSS